MKHHLTVIDERDGAIVFEQLYDSAPRPFVAGERCRIGTEPVTVIRYTENTSKGATPCVLTSGETADVQINSLVVRAVNKKPWPYLPALFELSSNDFVDNLIWAVYRLHRLRPGSTVSADWLKRLPREEIIGILNPLQFSQRLRDVIEEAFPDTRWPEDDILTVERLLQFEEERESLIDHEEECINAFGWFTIPQINFFPGNSYVGAMMCTRILGDPRNCARSEQQYFNIAYGVFCLLQSTKEIRGWMEQPLEELGDMSPKEYLVSVRDLRGVVTLMRETFTPEDLVRGIDN